MMMIMMMGLRIGGRCEESEETTVLALESNGGSVPCFLAFLVAVET